jgi:hypothetical protein
MFFVSLRQMAVSSVTENGVSQLTVEKRKWIIKRYCKMGERVWGTEALEKLI